MQTIVGLCWWYHRLNIRCFNTNHRWWIDYILKFSFHSNIAEWNKLILFKKGRRNICIKAVAETVKFCESVEDYFVRLSLPVNVTTDCDWKAAILTKMCKTVKCEIIITRNLIVNQEFAAVRNRLATVCSNVLGKWQI